MAPSHLQKTDRSVLHSGEHLIIDRQLTKRTAYGTGLVNPQNSFQIGPRDRHACFAWRRSCGLKPNIYYPGIFCLITISFSSEKLKIRRSENEEWDVYSKKGGCIMKMFLTIHSLYFCNPFSCNPQCWWMKKSFQPTLQLSLNFWQGYFCFSLICSWIFRVYYTLMKCKMTTVVSVIPVWDQVIYDILYDLHSILMINLLIITA